MKSMKNYTNHFKLSTMKKETQIHESSLTTEELENLKAKDLQWVTPLHLCEIIKEDDRQIRQGIFSYKAYTMLVALANYSSSHCGSRALFYLKDNGELDYKKDMMKSEGGFMSAVLEGDLLLALKRADVENLNALCEGIRTRTIDI